MDEDEEHMEEDMSSEEEGELRGNDKPGERQQSAHRPSTSSTSGMANLVKRKQQETSSQFSDRIIGIGSGNDVQVKQEAGDVEGEATTNPPNAVFVAPCLSEMVKTGIASQDETYIHEVFYPIGCLDEDIDLSSVPDVQPVKKFSLDNFQKEAIKCVANDRSVLVSAPNLSGKTAIAIHAISQALKNKKRAIYTTPSKALSNQKYKQLGKEFPSIGLFNGDLCINPDADILVMTTKILRNKLYKQDAEMIKNLEWVIFDKIHCMQDPERGVLLEESIIMLPPVNFLFLSAKIQNGGEFAQWMAYSRQKPCHLVSTLMRPAVPLIHYIFPSTDDQLIKIAQNDRFEEQNFDQAMALLKQPLSKDKIRKSQGTNQTIGKDNLRKVIRTLRERNIIPILVFSFSRQECEMCAVQIKQMDFNSDEEKNDVILLFKMAIEELAENEKNLKQLNHYLPYFLRGIAVHHSGLLPIVREIVELLFERSLIKVLIATETFAMDVDMSARCVVFTSANKFDGQCIRWLTNGEYVQMSGKAGSRDMRTGETDGGIVILMTDQQMEMEEAEAMIIGNEAKFDKIGAKAPTTMLGPDDHLMSQYRLNYNMILNQIRIGQDAMTFIPETMLKNSFLQWQTSSSINRLKRVMNEKKKEWKSAQMKREDHQLASIQGQMKQIEKLNRQIKQIALIPRRVVPFLNPGRLLKIKHLDKDFDWGVLINCQKVPCPLPNSSEMMYILNMAVMLTPESARHLPNLESIRPPASNERAVLAFVPFSFECISEVSARRLKLPENMDMNKKEAREALVLDLKDAKNRWQGEIPLLHPCKDMLVCDENVDKWVKEKEELEAELKENPLKRRSDFEELFAGYKKKEKFEGEYKEAKKRYLNVQKLVLKDELKKRLQVLRSLFFLSPNLHNEDGPPILTDKGKVACELISIGDTLVLAEMLFNRFFNELNPNEIAAILSCFVFDERVPFSLTDLSPRLTKYYSNIQEYVRKIAKLEQECGIELDAHKYLERINPGMVNAVYKWCQGNSLKQLLESSEIYEGSMVCCFRCVDQLLAEIIEAIRLHNDIKHLEPKFVEARQLLQHGLPFAASIYT